MTDSEYKGFSGVDENSLELKDSCGGPNTLNIQTGPDLLCFHL